jgi:Uma2 family endonuclease
MADNAFIVEQDDGRICNMGSRRRATVGDLYRVGEDVKAELVNGELVVMTPGGGLHGYTCGAIYASLANYARRTGRGIALPDNVGFLVRLPHRRSFSPDAAFWIGGPLTAEFVDGSPVFAVEVRSKDDFGAAAERALAAKRADYFAAGTLVVWDVDIFDRQVVDVYRSADPDVPVSYSRGMMAEAETALSGWSMPVDELFPRGGQLKSF